ncbi:MAG TPA: hypothetical protein VJT72_11880 [Pseudonocardiaceae bacterium]|nr:hypothetical protein [Pseudonocardiaceae bacterium]
MARRLNYSRPQLYQILDGGICRPPEWDRLVEPLVRACTGAEPLFPDPFQGAHGCVVVVERRHEVGGDGGGVVQPDLAGWKRRRIESVVVVCTPLLPGDDVHAHMVPFEHRRR